MRWTRVFGALLMASAWMAWGLTAGCASDAGDSESPSIDEPTGVVQEALLGLGESCSYDGQCTSGHCCGAPKVCTSNCCDNLDCPLLKHCAIDCGFGYQWSRGCCNIGYTWCYTTGSCLRDDVCEGECYLGK